MDLDKLQEETEKLLSLLRDRQQGMMTWNCFLGERLRAIVDLADKAGIRAELGPF